MIPFPRCLARLALIPLSAAIIGCGGDEDTPPTSPPDPSHFEIAGDIESPGRAVAVGSGGIYVAAGEALAVSTDGGETFSPLAAQGLPRGHVNQLTAFPGDPDQLVAYVWGKGLFRSDDGGESFETLERLPTYGLLEGFITPRAEVVPFGSGVDPEDGQHGVLAGLGGLYRTDDSGQIWQLLEPSVVPGKFYLFWFDADVRGDTIVAAAQSPSTLLPPNLAGLVAYGVVVSRDDGETFEDITGDLPARAITGVAIADDGTIYATALDGGLYRHDGDARWTSLGGPFDAVELAVTGRGVSVGSGTRGLWRYEPDGWSQVGQGATVDLVGPVGLTYDGTVYSLVDGLGDEPPAPPAAPSTSPCPST